MKNWAILFIGFLFTMTLSSCGIGYYSRQVLYEPTKSSFPLFSEPRQFYGTLSPVTGSFQNNALGADFQFGYSMGSNFALIGNGYYFRGKKRGPHLWYDPVIEENIFGEFGIGYYKPLTNTVVFELYGGGGIGSMHIKDIAYTNNQIRPDPYSTSLPYTKFFAQPNIGYKKELVEFGFASRFSQLQFEPITSEQIENLSMHYPTVVGIYQSGTFSFWEPSLCIRLGWQRFKFEVQYLRSYQVSGPSIERKNNTYSVGMMVRF